jgi:phosphopantothenoylcysteine decarboxylase/phosphopantothenate--cysteine ligase
MAASAARAAGDATIIAAAAVADYRPAERRADKEAKLAGASSLALEATPDVVASLPRRPELIVVGFAAETQDLVSRARAKLERKRLDLIVANDVSAEDAGFDVDTNRVTLIGGDGATELPLLAKDDVADAVLDRIREIRSARPLREAKAAGLAARRASRAS